MTATDPQTSTPTSPPTTVDIAAEVREGEYGSRVVAVEPGGAEFIALSERHGRPLDLFWTWMSPNLEFATIYVGVIAVLFFGQSFWQAVAAIVLGTALGSATHGVLSSRGPAMGVPQMILSRIGFGQYGNALPAGLNALVAGIGWFAVNSVSGALALATLTKLPDWLCLVLVVAAQIAVAFFGHNLVHAFERLVFPLLAVVFLITSVVILSKSHPGYVPEHTLGVGGFLLTLGATFGYAAGWNPYATDYTRYLPPSTSKRAVGVWAGLGVFVSCTVLEIVGAASATLVSPASASPTAAFTGHLATWLADLTLLCIAIGAICANAINIYSGAVSFLALGIKLPLALRRAIVAAVAGVIGFALALSSLHDPERYEDFLLIIAYWIGPWLGVYLTDWYLRRGTEVSGYVFDRRHNPWAGVVAMAIGTAVSVVLFANQVKFQGYVARHYASLGDIAFEVGFVLTAALYVLFFKLSAKEPAEKLVIAGT
jgi:nucleobase:cation symporter-1, NCS1 family